MSKKQGKKQEKEALKAYKTYFDSYIHGDIKAIATLLSDDYTQIGSAEAEVFFDKKEAMQFLRETIDQVAGKAEMRQRELKTVPLQDYMLIIDQFDMYALTDDKWSFYAKLRASTLMEKTAKGWKFVYQHSSMPDTRAVDGDNIAIEKISAENQQLREAVQRRTVELESKNRELEIEAGLERVRARAMVMQTTDELADLIVAVFQELQKLDMELTRGLLWIFNPEDKSATAWLANVEDPNSADSYHVPYHNHPTYKSLLKGWQGQQQKWQYDLKGKVKDRWDEELVDGYFKSLPKKVKKAMKAPERIILYGSFNKYGVIQTAGLELLSDHNQDILQRFSQVFDQTYTRFLDLQKAEAQAREAQIEAALEKVRSRSLAMHKSEELKEVIVEVRNKFQELDISMESRVAVVVVFDKNSRDFNQWIDSPNFANIYFSTPYFENPVLKDFWTAKEGGVDFYSNSYSLEVKNSYFNYFFDHSIYKNVDGLEEQKKWLFEQAFYTYSPALEKNSSIGIADFSGKALTESEIEIIKRFAKVFEQAYIRFLDLQKAEAQAREAQIEAALEKVRARSMAMQNSSELQEAANLLFEQIQELGVPAWSCGFNIFTEDKKSSTCWMSSEGEIQEPFNLPFAEEASFLEWNKVIKRKQRFFVQELGGKALESHYAYMKTLPGVGEVIKKLDDAGISLPSYQINHLSFFKHGFLLFITYEPVPEMHEVFQRFTAVFEQTYTRFLDLQKAEDQAREAEIELALERVRARTMAMQHSNELPDAALLLFQQVENIGVPVFGCGFNIWDEDRISATAWMAGKDRLQPPFNTSSSKDIFLRIHKAAEQGESLFIEEQGGKQLAAHYKYMASIPVFKEIMDKIAQSGHSLPSFQIMHCAYFSHGYLMFISHEAVPNSYDIFQRFSQVFEQTYTRFLDLQKAEAQAREAEIELALERIRARTMAMQHSDELIETSELLFDQFKALGANAEQVSIGIVDEEKKVLAVSATFKGNKLEKMIESRIDEHPVIQKVYKAWKSKKKSATLEIVGKELQDYNKWRNKLGKAKFNIKGEYNASRWIINLASFSNGMLSYSGEEPAPADTLQLLERFAAVFEQTYTRFLDLQKAEEQTREAHIEVALERIRARTMAMHKSEEMKDVIKELFDELNLFELKIDICTIDIFDGWSKDLAIWTATPEQNYATELRIPAIKNPMFDRIYNIRINKQTLLTDVLTKKQKDSFYRHALKNSVLGQIMSSKRLKRVMSAGPMNRSAAIFDNTALMVLNFQNKVYSASENDIIIRFGKVFEQTYSRFLDLQKAEEQAGEAKIETELEKVRAKSMAMHKSEELRHVVNQSFIGLTGLGIRVDTAFIITERDKDIKKGYRAWAASNKGFYQEEIHVPYRGLKVDVLMHKAWQNREDSHFVFTKKSKDQIIRKSFELSSQASASIPEARKKKIFEAPGLTYYDAYRKNLSLAISKYDSEKYPNEDIDVISRFADVLDQSYTRFLDLQKAEEQAMEAKIEVALEKVRASSMAMHKSEELQEVANTLFKGLNGLNIETDGIAIFIFRDYPKNVELWLGTEQGYSTKFNIPFTRNTLVKPIWDAIGTRKELLTRSYSYEDKNKFWNHMFNHSDFKYVPKERKKFILDAKGYSYSLALCKNTGVQNHRYSEILFSDKENNILKRFADVFEQSYIRFLDLQKAEEQAREAQVEIGLERVRAEMMAMHKSDELRQVVGSVFTQLQILGFEAPACSMIIYNEDLSAEHWFTGMGHETYPKSYKIPYVDNPYFTDLLNAWKKGTSFQEFSMEGKLKIAYAKWLLKHSEFKNLPKEFQKEMLTPDLMMLSDAFNRYGMLEIIGPESLSEDKITILQRFSQVFEQTYTRFLDLQKAEAQVREAHIEASLERVRAASMAMHHSADLQSVISVVLEQFEKLEITVHTTYISEQLEDTKAMHFWIAATGQTYLEQTHIPRINHPFFNEFYKAIKNGTSFFTSSFTKAERDQFFRHYFKNSSHHDVPLERQEFLFSAPGLVSSTVLFDKTALGVYRYNKDVFTDEENEVIKRIGFVFEQAYTRFLDLQKAEGQAKEAQIEASLERVRSSMMAMHKSEDLLVSANLLYSEFKSLGITQYFTCGFVIVDEEKSLQNVWITDMDGEIFESFNLPLIGDPVFQQRYEKWQQKVPVFYQKVGGVKLKKHLAFAIPHFGSEEAEDMVANQFPDPTYFYMANFSHGYLHIVGDTKLTDEEEQLLARFTGVFQQTYIRFLDLQKAEEQAREAQIEASLERVRAASMAMHHSADLQSVITVVLKQFEKLEIPVHAAYINDQLEDTKATHLWAAATGQTYLQQTHIPRIKHPFFDEFYKAIKEDKSFYTLILNKAEKDKLFRHYFKNSSHQDVPLERQEFIFSTPGLVSSNVLFDKTALSVHRYNKDVYTDEENSVITRIGFVFEQAYTRFLDLQKAEAQAREAQIEVSLERVRAASMAMHHSVDLQTVITVVLKQFEKLGIQVHSTFIAEQLEDTKAMHFWVAANGQTYLRQTHIPKIKNTFFIEFYKAIKNGTSFYTTILTKAEKNQFFRHYYKNSSHYDVPLERQDFVFSTPGMVSSTVLFAKTALTVQRYNRDVYTVEENEVIRRIGFVFEQAYTRFLDLQKAEAQVREAKIEAALERVRSRTMGMHISTELAEIIGLINQEMYNLGLEQSNSTVVVDFDLKKPEKGSNHWMSIADRAFANKFHVEHDEKLKRFNPSLKFISEAKKGVDFYSVQLSKEKKNQFIKHLFSQNQFNVLAKRDKEIALKAPGWIQSVAIQKNSAIQVTRFTTIPFSEDQNDIIKRFGVVLEQSYTRFLDLRTAEEQAREAQIEAALERVRAKSMAMHKTSELKQVIDVISQQFEILGITQDACMINIFGDKTNKDWNFWIATYPDQIHVPYFKNPITSALASARKNNKTFYTEALNRKDKDGFFEQFYKKAQGVNVPQKRKKVIKRAPGWTGSVTLSRYTSIHLVNYNNVPYTEEENEILRRIGNAFEQAYTRFLDLQKAEAQAHEAQIEAGLERVRAKAMAMHDSKDLPATASVAFTELRKLGIEPMRSGISIHNKENRKNLVYTAARTKKGDELSVVGYAMLDNHPVLSQIYDNWLAGEDYFPHMKGKVLRTYYEQITNTTIVPKEQSESEQYGYFISFTHGMFYGWSKTTYTENQKLILKRFGSVLDLTFNRYFDLQKAEAQVREAQVEASLERVRAKAMAMHSTEDITDTVGQLFQELDSLDVSLLRCGVARIQKGTRAVKIHAFSGTQKGTPVPVVGNAILAGHPVLNATYQGWVKQEEYHAVLKGASLKKFLQLIEPDFKLPKRKQDNQVQYGYFFYFSAGCLYTFTETEFTEEELTIFRKFSSVVGLTYRRFLDLAEAEVQVREAQVEASLERVRSKAMAMHSSADLVDTANQLFKEFERLEISFLRCGVLRIYENKNAEVYSYGKNKDNEPVAIYGDLKLEGHEGLDAVFNSWQLQKEYSLEMNPESVKRYYLLVNKHVNIPSPEREEKQFGYTFYFPEGCLYCFTNEKMNEETLQIMRRFNQVMGLTYRRYFELKEAEARALAAIKESSLDRVRAEIASMRTATDLGRITPLIWRELTQLGVPFFRCGIFIINEDEQIVHAYLSTPDGEAVTALHIPINGKDNLLIMPAVENWRLQRTYKADWDREKFIQQTKVFMDKGQIEDPKSYKIADSPPERLVLHLVPFKQGMLYAGSTEPLSQEHIGLMKDLAKAFSVAYARYEDFVELENAKTKVEGTLNELKSTQDQLVQSEKMASLGELTAGIAHEIQNPLNFVNNFSEVSAELIEEMNEELKAGNLEDVKEITADLIQNLEKINHHGKRASGIVKGMLEHSRTGSSEKELTDINKLADEYLRLSYHGLRAKDKSFNADFKTDFDETLPKVAVITQDLGRVILNLINNAFYACTERSRSGVDKDYKPLVKVSTQKLKDKIEIRVKDNGSGIPANIKDKIFEPFFTTKPTGSGTGLGLSMSYDIITIGHGGELRVESEVGEGSEFIIQLPNV